MTGKFRTTIISLLTALSFVLAACGNAGEESQNAVEESGSAAEQPDSIREEENIAAEEAGGAAGDGEAGPDDSDSFGRELTPEEIEALYKPADEKVTVMVYLTGSDLESSAAVGTNDLQERAESGIDLSRVDLLVYTGGSKMWHSEDPEIPADANALYHLKETGYEQAEVFDQLSMGDPASLTRFLQYSYDHYPADSFVLILWDHGNGPVIGYGNDKQYGGDSLTLQEMKEALDASPFGEDNHLALIGFDACLMSSAELACTMSKYADYLVASQETEPSFGWNYDFLGMCGRISTEDLAREIVREYAVFCKSYFENNEFFQSDVTLAVIDLSHAGELEQAIDRLFLKASNDVSGDYSKLASARVHTHGFGRASTGSEYDLVDIESLAAQMEKKYPNEVRQLRAALGRSVLVSESNIGESCGLSLFYPYYNKIYYKKNWKEAYQALDAFPSYSSYLSRFDQVWLGTDLMDAFDETLVVQKGEGAGTFTMQLTPEQEEQYASSRYFILQRISDNLYTVVYLSSDITDKKGLLTANFDGNIIYFSDNYGEKGIPFVRMFETIEGVTDYTCRAYAERPPEDPEEWFNEQLTCEIQFAVDTKTQEVKVKGIYEDEEDEESIGTGKKQPVDLSEWAQLCFYQVGSCYLTRDEQGRVLPFTEWPRSDWISYYEMPLANGLNFTYEPIYDDGSEYFIMFEVADVSDNKICSELLPISLAEAPPEEQAKDAVEVEWNGGNSMEFFNEEGVTLELLVMKDSSSRKNTYMLHAANGNDYGVKVSLGDLYVNDTISYTKVGRNTINAYLDPGEDDYSEIEDIGLIRTYAGIGTPESLQFTIKVSRQDNFGYIVYNRPYHVTINGGITPLELCIPVLGARADSQVLGEEDGVRVELLGLGRYVGSLGVSEYFEDLTARLKFTNVSGEDRTAFLLGMEVNGIFYDQLLGCELKDGESWCVMMTAEGEDLRVIDTNYPRYGREDRLTEISEINFQVGTLSPETGEKASLYSFPVVLAEKGTQEPFEAEGEVVYENDEVRISLDSAGTGKDYNEVEGYYWELWIENKTGRYLSYNIYEVKEDGSDKYLTYTELGFGCRQLIQVGYPVDEMTADEIQVRLKSESDSIPPTEQFTLKATQ